ncbi:MAG: ABC transporter substrate-binding protein [Clostridia bacterium]|nr:ABC transporter substrate-binding protein [Clostridia bacterium]
MKRLLALCCVLLLTACAPLGSQPADLANPPNIPTLIWWTVGPEPVDFDIGIENINRYLEEHLELRLDMRMLPWMELMETTQKAVAFNEYFDIMFVDFENYNMFATSGGLWDITDALRVTAPNLWAFIPDQIWAGTKIDGRIYAVPTYKDSALAQYWVYDKAVVDASGIDIQAVRTWDDLDVALRQVKSAGGEDFYPVLLNRNDTFSGLFNGFDGFCNGLPIIGVRIDDPERRVICLLEDPVFLERLAMLRKWYQTGIINPDANTAISNRGSRFFLSSVGWPGAELVWQRSEKVDEYVSQVIYGPVLSTESIQGSMNAISHHSAYQAEALKLLQRINLDPLLRDMFAYGVEGVHFEYASDRVVRQLNKNWDVHIFSQGTLFTISTTTDWPADQWEQVKAQNDAAISSVLLGYSMDIRELSIELSASRAIWDVYSVDLTTGAADLDIAIPQLLAKLRGAGMDIIISEAEKQIDRHYGAGR